MDTLANIFSLSFTLFLLMDSIGNVPLFISILKNFDAKTQKRIIRRELVIALGIIIAFYFFGQGLMRLIEIKQETLLIAGGIILFLVAINMVFPPDVTERRESSSTKQPLIVPLATPFIAGPAVLAAVMLYSEQKTPFVALSSIFIAWIASVLILTSAAYLKKLLGDRGVLACEKLMGLLLILIAVQMCLKGITQYIFALKQIL